MRGCVSVCVCICGWVGVWARACVRLYVAYKYGVEFRFIALSDPYITLAFLYIISPRTPSGPRNCWTLIKKKEKKIFLGTRYDDDGWTAKGITFCQQLKNCNDNNNITTKGNRDFSYSIDTKAEGLDGVFYKNDRQHEIFIGSLLLLQL